MVQLTSNVVDSMYKKYELVPFSQCHPEVIEYSKEILDRYGSGLSSVRFICGTQSIHKVRNKFQLFNGLFRSTNYSVSWWLQELERKLSKFHRREDTILYASCFDANAGIFEVVLTPDDAVFSDELNHASIIDGIRLCKAKKQRYRHRDMAGQCNWRSFQQIDFEFLIEMSADLEEKLKSTDARVKLIATDGVFSMDGNVAPLKEICDLADKYNALVFVDECHATGFFGKTGR